MNRPTERTAAEVYAERRKAIDASIERLHLVLEVFDAWHRNSPGDWSLVGDAGAVNTGLTNLLIGCEAAEVWQREWSGKNGGAR